MIKHVAQEISAYGNSEKGRQARAIWGQLCGGGGVWIGSCRLLRTGEGGGVCQRWRREVLRLWKWKYSHCSSILTYLFTPKTTQPVLFPQLLHVYAVYTSVVGAAESLIRMLVQSRLTLADSYVPVKKSKASYPTGPRTQPSGSQHRVSS